MRGAERALLGLAAALACAGALSQVKQAPAPVAQAKHRNVTAGGELRHGVYGRIEPGRLPPPVIYGKPVVASGTLLPPGTPVVYLYVPPGQVRKWSANCHKWDACGQPVMFVRMDDSPSRLGQWKQLKDAYAFSRF